VSADGLRGWLTGVAQELKHAREMVQNLKSLGVLPIEPSRERFVMGRRRPQVVTPSCRSKVADESS
jgi:hypothetical protein